MTSTPVAWMHSLHMEDGQTAVRLARTEIDRPWGKPGIDFDRTYSVMIEPLYTHPSTDLLPVAYIQQEVLDVLAKDKTATGTVCSGLIQKPFGNPVPLYTHPAPSGQAVAVKPLEWELSAGNYDGQLMWSPKADIWPCWIVKNPNVDHYTWCEEIGIDMAPASPVMGTSPTLEAAKAAAQADYERRILSALSQPHPADERAVEGLPECAAEGCENPATVYFERGGIGSYYCHDCYMRVQALAQDGRNG